jgi:hypothetical protein
LSRAYKSSYMDLHDQRELESEIDRELKRLPDLSAPATLIPRVMAALAARAEVRWYRRPWQNWPMAWRLASFAVLMALLGGICFGNWHAVQLASQAPGLQQVGVLTSSLSTAHSALSAVAAAGALAVRQLGTTVFLATCLAVVLSYVLCVGLGTLCVRLAFARR